jgi:hypothetical protein
LQLDTILKFRPLGKTKSGRKRLFRDKNGSDEVTSLSLPFLSPVALLPLHLDIGSE